MDGEEQVSKVFYPRRTAGTKNVFEKEIP